jgi:S1-C subfamily serine protease
MTTQRPLLSAALLALSLTVALPSPVRAALPASVDGQPLPTLAPMLEQATLAVVNIATESRVALRRNPLLDDPFFRHFFNIPDQPRARKAQSVGSGVVVDARRGYVITNHHVIDGAEKITVTLSNGRQLAAKVIGSDSESDVAVIQIPGDKLTALPLADSQRLRVGDFVVAIGNPFGLGQTVTSGIVSALGRTGLGIQGYEDFIQTDASINPGNSGGALVNLRGELVGVNTAIIAPGGGNVGIGFAIPSNMVSRLMNQIIAHGSVRRGQLGVSVQDLTPELAQAFNIPGQSGRCHCSGQPSFRRCSRRTERG